MALRTQAGWEGYPPLQNKYKEHEFLAACREGNCPAVNFYLEIEGFNCNEELNSGRDQGTVTGLCIASQEGHTEVVRSLIAAEADVDRGCNEGATPLFVASQNGHAEVVRTLIEAGANPALPWRIFHPQDFRFFRRTPLAQAKYMKLLALPGTAKRRAYNDIISRLSQAHGRSLPLESNDATDHQADESTPLLSTMKRLSLPGKPV